MIKHFDDDTLDIFRERIGREKAALMTAALTDLYIKTVELMADAVQPESEKGQIFAKEIWETLVELSDSDMTLMLKLSEQMEKASVLENKDGEEWAAARHFMQRALGAFHSNRMNTAKSMRNGSRPSRNCERFNAISATGGTDFELFCYRQHSDEALAMFQKSIDIENTGFMTVILFDLYEEAVRLLAESSPPEGEKGQIFAGKLWGALVEISDGDADTMLKISEHMEKASSLGNEKDAEIAAVRDYMKQALETYHNIQSKGDM